jgi:hypothetical protein
VGRAHSDARQAHAPAAPCWPARRAGHRSPAWRRPGPGGRSPGRIVSAEIQPPGCAPFSLLQSCLRSAIQPTTLILPHELSPVKEDHPVTRVGSCVCPNLVFRVECFRSGQRRSDGGQRLVTRAAGLFMLASRVWTEIAKYGTIGPVIRAYARTLPMVRRQRTYVVRLIGSASVGMGSDAQVSGSA